MRTNLRTICRRPRQNGTTAEVCDLTPIPDILQKHQSNHHQSIKPFWPLIFTFILPRAINYYRVVKTAVRTRPPPRPLPKKTGRGLNTLFASICFFLYASLPFHGDLAAYNIFVVTRSHLMISTDVLFARVALMRENGMLTRADEALKSKLTSSTYVSPCCSHSREDDTNFVSPSIPASFVGYDESFRSHIKHLD